MARHGRLPTKAQWEKILSLLPNRPPRLRACPPLTNGREVLERGHAVLRWNGVRAEESECRINSELPP